MLGAEGSILWVRAHPRRKRHYEVGIEGDAPLIVHEDVVVSLGLREGAPVSSGLRERIAHAQIIAEARKWALAQLRHRPRGREELARGLRRRSLEQDVIEQVLAELENLGYVNDEQYARDVVRSLLRRQPYGRQGLLYRLRQRGVCTEVAEGAVAELLEGADESQLASEALNRRLTRWKSLPRDKRRARAYRFLMGLGYEQDAISHALSATMTDDEP